MTSDEARTLLGLTGAFTPTELAAAYRDAARDADEDELRRLGEARDVLRRLLLAASAEQQWTRTATIPIQVVTPEPRPVADDRVDSPTFVEGVPGQGASTARRTGGDPVVTAVPAAPTPTRRRPRAGLAVAVGVASLTLLAGGIAALTASHPASPTAQDDPSTAATGVQVAAPEAAAAVAFTVTDGPSNACSGGEDCWAWRVTADGACRSASADLQLSRSANGEPVRVRHLGIGAFSDGVARTVTVDARAGDPAFASLAVRCDTP